MDVIECLLTLHYSLQLSNSSREVWKTNPVKFGKQILRSWKK
jgi:hypothetical protein